MRPLHIYFAQSISCQDSFNTKDFFSQVKKITADSVVQSPNYKEYFKGAQLRRLSTILKAGMCIAVTCEKSSTKPIDSIIVGTGLGCLTDTGKFLQNIKNQTGDLLSPTAFIQSTHNTISGQISILLNNKGYNNTHSQNSLSFEMSLIDAMSEFSEGKEAVLVGGIDEVHPFMEVLNSQLNIQSNVNTFCASFFVVHSKASENKISIKSVYTDFSKQTTSDFVSEVCETENVYLSHVDLVLHSGSCNFDHPNSINYIDFTGHNLSASALATHFAYDFLAHSNFKTVLVLNDLCEHKGAIFIKKND